MKVKGMTLEMKLSFILAIIICSITVYVLNTFLTDEPSKPDGLVFIAINGEIVKTIDIGHRAAIHFCQQDNNFVECQENFMGCGAFNCYCNFENERIGELLAVLEPLAKERDTKK